MKKLPHISEPLFRYDTSVVNGEGIARFGKWIEVSWLLTMGILAVVGLKGYFADGSGGLMELISGSICALGFLTLGYSLLKNRNTFEQPTYHVSMDDVEIRYKYSNWKKDKIINLTNIAGLHYDLDDVYLRLKNSKEVIVNIKSIGNEQKREEFINVLRRKIEN